MRDHDHNGGNGGGNGGGRRSDPFDALAAVVDHLLTKVNEHVRESAEMALAMRGIFAAQRDEIAELRARVVALEGGVRQTVAPLKDREK